MKDEKNYACGLLDDKEKALYQEIYAGILRGKHIISYAQKCMPATVNKIIKYILLDHPELFWFEGKWGYKELGQGMQIGFKYTMPWESVSGYRERLWTEIKKITDGLTGDDIQRAKQIYDWMHENISYGKYTAGQNVKDALIMRDAVCKGMAKAYQLLLAETGIFSMLSEGSIDGMMKHVWNVAELNGKYYHVDVAMGYEEVWMNIGIEKQKAGFFGMSEETVGRYCKIDEMEWMHCHCDTDLFWE